MTFTNSCVQIREMHAFKCFNQSHDALYSTTYIRGFISPNYAKVEHNISLVILIIKIIFLFLPLPLLTKKIFFFNPYPPILVSLVDIINMNVNIFISLPMQRICRKVEFGYYFVVFYIFLVNFI
jgi:uncharacterized membrane protein